MSAAIIELSIIILITVFIAAVLRLMKQPLIISYIVSGVILGPYFLNIVRSHDEISTFGSIGIALLLFMVGLHLNPKVIKEIGKVSTVSGMFQLAVTFFVGLGLGLLLGFSWVEALYLSAAMAFSSTIVVMKILSDKGEIDTLYGKISIGILIIQDLIVVIVFIIVSSLARGATFLGVLKNSVLNGGLLIVGVILISMYFFPKITKGIVRSQEFLLLFAIGWCLVVSVLFEASALSFEVGALIAGISLSYSPYAHEIYLKMKPLRDFFIFLFFILLGSQMQFENLGVYVIPAIVFSLLILVGNPLAVMSIVGLLGYTKRTSFLSGLAMAQISEFSIILIGMGVAAGHLSTEMTSLITLVGLITIAGSTYFMLYNQKLFHKLSPYLGIFERKGKRVDERIIAEEHFDIVLFGCNRIGFTLLESFTRLKKKFLVIDNDPDVVENLEETGYVCRYSDASNVELLNEINLEKVKMVVSTIPDIDVNISIINKVKLQNLNTIVIVVSHHIDEALRLYDAGATYVIMPHFLGGDSTSVMIEEHGLNLDRFLRQKVEHIEHLHRRRRAGHEHPHRG